MTNKKKVASYISSLKDVSNKTIIISGANSGLGFALSDILLTKGAHIVLACRNLSKASKAREELLSKHPNSNIDILEFNQSSIEDIKNTATRLKRDYMDFYALVLNAGVFKPNRSDYWHNDIPMTSGVNFFSLVLLLSLLNKDLESSDIDQRIIIQGSVAGRIVSYKNLSKSLLDNDSYLLKQYCNSKLGDECLFRYYLENHSNKHIKYLLAEPGACNSGIIRNYPKWFRPIASGFMKLTMHNATSGALSAAKLVCDDVNDGEYYRPRGLFSISGLPHQCKTSSIHYNPRIVIEAEEYLNKIK